MPVAVAEDSAPLFKDEIYENVHCPVHLRTKKLDSREHNTCGKEPTVTELWQFTWVLRHNPINTVVEYAPPPIWVGCGNSVSDDHFGVRTRKSGVALRQDSGVKLGRLELCAYECAAWETLEDGSRITAHMDGHGIICMLNSITGIIARIKRLGTPK
jgi:hypothetical protein